MMPLSRRLVALLASGERWLRADLAAALGVEIEAVDALLSALVKTGSAMVVSGVDVGLPGAIELLERDFIWAQLASDVAGVLNRFDVAGVVTSTNAVLLADVGGAWPAVSVLMAEGQSAGRGRTARRWHSPLGTHVYLSMVFKWTKPLIALGGFTPALGIGMARALRRCGVAHVKVKWPNDLFHEDAKMAGVLVETRTLSSHEHRVVVGVGINVGADRLGIDVGQAHTSVSVAANVDMSRNLVATWIIDAMYRTFEDFARHGLDGFLDDWRGFDYFAGNPVRAVGRAGTIHGVCRGLARDGGLLLDCAGSTITVTAGEVSLRAAGGT